MNKLNNEAVSPVIGVILMVAITVILAAVIAVFVFGMADDIQTTKTVAVNVDRINQSTVQVTYMGGPDHSNLEVLDVKFDDIDKAHWENGVNLTVGTTGTYADDGKDIVSVIVVGTFTDGSEQVLYNSRV